MAIQTKGKKEKALKKPPSTWFVVNNDGLPSIVLNEIDRLADVEVDTSSLSNIETHGYPTLIEIQSENHSSSESNLESGVSNLTLYELITMLNDIAEEYLFHCYYIASNNIFTF